MRKLLLTLAVSAAGFIGFSQQSEGPSISGNAESVFQYLQDDETIGATQPAEIGLLNSYMNVFYTQGNFKAGMRIESYLPRIQGYPSNFNGTGIGMRYVGYANDFIDITLGSFYEQFGSGLAFRAYEDRTLGYDNMMDGARVIFRPMNGLTIKGVYGYQRYQFDSRIIHGEGIVRGFDGEANLNQLFKSLSEKKLNITIGGSFVSKYQADDVDSIIIPENVGAYGGRVSLRYGKFTLNGEYIFKGQDPNADQYTTYNRINYNNGHAAVINFGYSQKGLGILLSAKSVDNMSYRSDRNESLQNLLINFLPSMNKVHTYNLVSSLYPWATQPLGEVAYQAEVLYTIKKGSKLGGKYGTKVNVNASFAMRPWHGTYNNNIPDSTGVAYISNPFSGADLGNFDYLSKDYTDNHNQRYYNNRNFFWQDININIERKFNKKFNLKLSYFNIMMNNDVNKVTAYAHGTIISNIFVAEASYIINKHHSIRGEIQTLIMGKYLEHSYSIDSLGNGIHHDEEMLNDKGHWVTPLIEYNFSPHWFFSIMDQINIESGMESVYSASLPDDYKSYDIGDIDLPGLHHIYISAGYIHGATRVTVGFGKQRAGLFCVGGICRNVPASNGLTLSITHSF